MFSGRQLVHTVPIFARFPAVVCVLGVCNRAFCPFVSAAQGDGKMAAQGLHNRAHWFTCSLEGMQRRHWCQPVGSAAAQLRSRTQHLIFFYTDIVRPRSGCMQGLAVGSTMLETLETITYYSSRLCSNPDARLAARPPVEIVQFTCGSWQASACFTKGCTTNCVLPFTEPTQQNRTSEEVLTALRNGFNH